LGIRNKLNFINKQMKNILPYFFVFFTCSFIHAQNNEYKIEQNIRYYHDSVYKTDKYAQEKCILDIYFPQNCKNSSTIIWFHGGALTGGSKEIPEALKNNKVIIVGVDYRLYPKVKCPVYIEDAAAAANWVFKNIGKYGGNPNLIFVSGHSAGGYLAEMIGLDKKWLTPYNIDANQFAAIIPFSGQAITHFTIRQEKGITQNQPIIDEYAPLFHVRADAPPLILITGDREMELLGRYEENAYLMRMMKLIGHKKTTLHELGGYGHMMVEPAIPLLLKHIKIITDSIK
jgi:acetyl esterase/lipase